jgi:hypothetical protein
LTPKQSYVDYHGIINKLRNRSDMESTMKDPIAVYKHPDGIKSIVDGTHRYFAKRLLGKKRIKAETF